MERLSKSINLLNDVAMGRRKADLVLEGCSLVSVYTGEIVPDTQVAIANGRIAYVGSDASHTIGSKTTTIKMNGKYLAPGFAILICSKTCMPVTQDLSYFNLLKFPHELHVMRCVRVNNLFTRCIHHILLC